MTARKPPILTRSELTGRVYIVTAYTVSPSGHISARTKFGVTEQFAYIELARKAEGGAGR